MRVQRPPPRLVRGPRWRPHRRQHVWRIFASHPFANTNLILFRMLQYNVKSKSYIMRRDRRGLRGGRCMGQISCRIEIYLSCFVFTETVKRSRPISIQYSTYSGGASVPVWYGPDQHTGNIQKDVVPNRHRRGLPRPSIVPVLHF